MVDRKDRTIFFPPLPVFKTVTIYYLQEGCVSFSGFSSFGALPSQQHMRLVLSWEHSRKGTWEEQKSSHWQLGHLFMSNEKKTPRISNIQPATAIKKELQRHHGSMHATRSMRGEQLSPPYTDWIPLFTVLQNSLAGNTGITNLPKNLLRTKQSPG